MFGEFDQGYEIMNKALSLAEESGNKRLLSRFYFYLGFLYHEKFEYKKMEDSLIKARKLAEELDNKFLLAQVYFYFAILYSRRRLPSQAVESSKKGLKLLEGIGSTFALSSWYSNLSNQLLATSQFDEALEYKQKSLEIGNLQKNSVIFGMANIYVLKNDLEKAYEYYFKALQLSKEIKDFRVHTFSLYKLVEISLLLDNYSLAKQYLQELQQLQKDSGLEFIILYCRVANVLVLKESNKFSDWGKAITELQALLADEDLDSHTRSQSLFWLLELRIKELQLSTTKESLEEVKKQAIRLEVVAKEERRRGFLFGAYRLQSQLALIELDAKQAVEFLEKAQIIADEMDYKFYHVRLNEDREKLKQQLTMLQELQEQQATMEEAIKLVSLGTTIQSIKEEAVVEERDKESGEIIEYRKLFVLKL
jgi:tetratricopeptide (TPR) repeat protein